MYYSAFNFLILFFFTLRMILSMFLLLHILYDCQIWCYFQMYTYYVFYTLPRWQIKQNLSISFTLSVGKYCNVADFNHVTFAFRRADFYNKIPSIGSQEESPHFSVQGHSYYCIICLLFFCYSFSCERKLCCEHLRGVIVQCF